MKKVSNKILLLFFALMLTFSYAQDNETSSRQLYIDYLGNVNTNDLETNFLLNKGFIDVDEIGSLYQFIETYEVENEGETNETITLIPPISQTEPNSWIGTYSSLLTSNISPAVTLETLEALDNRLKENALSFTEIPLLLFDVKGELLEENEIENSIANQTKFETYNQIHLFGGISFVNKFYRKSIPFKISAENYFTDDATNAQIFIDFSDGNGVQEFDVNHGIVTINYAEIGEKVIRIYRNSSFNGTESRIGTEFVINIVADINDTPSTIIESVENSGASAKILGDESTIITNGGAKAYVYHADNAAEVIDKPIIIVQGFDPTGEISADSQFSKYEIYKNYLDGINNTYDFVFVTFNNTNLSLNTNTLYLKDLIKKINNQKSGNFESVVIGESMGGLLSRMALKELENEGYDHEAGLYVSFDAPHQGANIPPGLQYLFDDLLNSRTVRTFDSFTKIIDLNLTYMPRILFPPLILSDYEVSTNKALGLDIAYRALGALKSTAAKSMIINHIDSDGYFVNSQNYLQELGYPEQTRNIALINGSWNNTDLQEKTDGSNLLPGDTLIREPLWNDWCNEFSFNAWASTTNRTSKVSEITFEIGTYIPEVKVKWENKCILRAFGKCRIKTKIPVKVQVGFTCATLPLNNPKYYTFDGAFHDGAPASNLPALGDEVPVDLKSSFGFVSTASAIDISEDAYNNNTDPNGLLAIDNRFVLNNLIEDDLTPFDDVYAKTGNSNHVFFNSGDGSNMRAIINDEIMPENLFLQNRVFTNDRDFESLQDINIGNSANGNASKIMTNGDVIFNSNTTSNLKAGNKIILSDGVYITKGAKVHLFVDEASSAKQLQNINPDLLFDVNIVGSTRYHLGESVSFKALVSNLDSNYDYTWNLVEKSNSSNVGEEYVIDELLYPGYYTAQLSITSKQSGETKTLTKVFQIDSNFDQSKLSSSTQIAENETNSVVIYPNPIKIKSTIIANKKIEKC